MSEFKVTPQSVYEATDGGLDIILDCYPQAAGCVGNKKSFKIRDESSASAVLTIYNGVYWVKDFGDSKKSQNAIDVLMSERKMTFGECMAYCADKYNLTDDKIKTKAQYGYERLAALEGVPEGDVAFETKEWDLAELQTVFAKNTWQRLRGMNKRDVKGKKEESSDELGILNATDICKAYGLIPLRHYDLTSRDKKDGNLIVHRFKATETYPILMWEAGTWQKIYKPKAEDKKYRFQIRGTKNRIMFGYAMAKKKFDDLLEDSEGEDETKKAKKLEEVIICSGGSDAINIAAMGYAVVWFDSEMFSLTSEEYTKLTSIAEHVYYLPDIDATGVAEAVKLGMEWLNVSLIFLPRDLANHYDARGNSCKDIRDFLNRNGAKELEICIKQSMPMRFWDEAIKLNKEGKLVKKNGRLQITYTPNNELIYNFLFRNDFGLYEIPSAKGGQMLVRKQGNIVRPIGFRNINMFLKDFLSSNAVMRLVGYNYIDVRNAFHRSAQFSENSMDNLKYLTLNFNDASKEHQLMFFENETWEIKAKTIRAIGHEKVKSLAWEDEVIPDRVKVLEPLFRVFLGEDGDYDIEILRGNCEFLNFIINTSRIHWRTELEVNLGTKTPEEQIMYKEANKFNISGPLLSPMEIKEQKLILISKLQSLGYLLHRHKDKAESYCVWALDYVMSGGAGDEDASNGGTGKSVMLEVLSRYMKTHFINGRDRKQLENPHILDGVSEHTDYMFVDDAAKNIDFDFFYGLITSFMPVNPKGTTAFTLPFGQSPKIAITSNFTPNRNDKSTRRRMWFVSFSDYYHKNPNNEYREERLPKEEFGHTLFEDFDNEQWNLTDNMLARCVQSWMCYGKIESGEDNVQRNLQLQKMGPGVLAWADELFHPDNGNLDTIVQRHVIYEDFKKKVFAGYSPQGFLERLKAWCSYKGYTLNPKDMLGNENRIMKRVDVMEYRNGKMEVTDAKGTRECIYIRSNAVSEVMAISEDAVFSKAVTAEGDKKVPF